MPGLVAPRVALVRQKYTHFGGAERFVAGALNAMVARGANLTVVTRHWQEQPGVEVIGVNPFYIGRVWRDRSFSKAACQIVAEGHFDLVQSHERIPCCDIYRAGDGVHRIWLRHRAQAGGWWVRLSQWLSPYHRYVLQAEERLFASDRLKAVICNSFMVKDEICKCFGIPEKKVVVIHNAVDTKRFSPNLRTRYRNEMRRRLDVPESAMVYLFVGSGFARKGLDAAIRAMAEMPDHCWLVVVGKDRTTSHYRRLARRLGLAGRVYFAGPQPDVDPYYGMADALILPTLYDPFPNVVLEALACGLPVLISDSCGATDIIRDGENGFVCPAQDLPGIIARMRRLMDAGLRETLMPVSRALVEHWDAERMSDRLLLLYRELLDGV